MPGYPWLFEGDATKPTAEGRDLVAYLQSLGRQRSVAALDGTAPAIAGGATMTGMPAVLARGTDDGRAPDFGAPAAGDEAALRNGAALFTSNCAGCHGAAARGDGPAAAALLPRPANLTTASLASARVSEVLWSGVRGSSMPSWRDLPLRDLRDLVAYVVALHAVEPVTSAAPADDVARLFARECASCHGETGRGDGVAGRILAPSPTNFHRKRPDQARAEAAITAGVPGSAMPRWSEKLNEQDRRALAAYVRALYEGEP